MGDGFYAEEGEYLIYCSGEDLHDGTWAASAYFERVADLRKTKVPGMRHRITSEVFDDEHSAAQAAHVLAIQLIKGGEVGL